MGVVPGKDPALDVELMLIFGDAVRFAGIYDHRGDLSEQPQSTIKAQPLRDRHAPILLTMQDEDRRVPLFARLQGRRLIRFRSTTLRVGNESDSTGRSRRSPCMDKKIQKN